MAFLCAQLNLYVEEKKKEEEEEDIISGRLNQLSRERGLNLAKIGWEVKRTKWIGESSTVVV